MKVLRYDTTKYPFAQTLAEWFAVRDLTKLHEIRHYEKLKRENDQSTVWHALFYKNFRGDAALQNNYVDFLRTVVAPEIDEPILYQRIPSFRVHLPENVGVGEFHRDRDYHHSRHEINFFLPLTRAWGTNTIWVESAEDRGDYTPMEADYGSCILWDGANLVHGNQTNTTGQTRVSLDFRVLPVSQYRETSEKSINGITEMRLGGYWDVLENPLVPSRRKDPVSVRSPARAPLRADREVQG